MGDAAILLAQLATSTRSAAVLVQDALGAVHVLPYLNRLQVDDPDVVVLATRDQALALIGQVAGQLVDELSRQGVLR